MKKLPKPKAPKKLATSHRTPIKPAAATKASSNITSHRYNPETGQLDVTFHGGRSYRYHGVSQETAGGIAGAPSLGTYLHSEIIGKHKATKL